MPASIRCSELLKSFGKAVVLDRLDWHVEAGAVVGLVGPSGTGKTTLLRVLAGLERCSSGTVEMSTSEGRTTGRVRTSMVFQDLALWPHLTARQHVRYVLPPRADARRALRAEDFLEEARLPPTCWDKRPAQLSGGEAQRLALARALASQPDLLLLDEPLAQMDTSLRGELLALIHEVVEARPATVIYVTHHCREAMEICQRIAVLLGGRVQREGTPEEVFWRPGCREVAQLTGPLVELPTRWLEESRVAAAPGLGAQEVPLYEEAGILAVRPQQVRFMGPEGPNCWEVSACRPDGVGWRVVLSQGSCQLQATCVAPPPSGRAVGIELAKPE